MTRRMAVAWIFALCALVAAGATPAVAAPSRTTLQRQLKAERARTQALREQLFVARSDLRETRADLASARAELSAANGSVATITAQRDGYGQQIGSLAAQNQALAAQVAAAQAGVVGAIGTMTAPQAFDLLSAIYARIPSNLTWDKSVYRSGSYVSYTFTYSP